MDENKGSGDGLPGQQGLPSTGKTGTPSDAPKTITITEAELHAQIEKAANERHSTLDKKVNELTQEINNLTPLKTQLEEAQRQLDAERTSRQNAELEALKGDPVKFDAAKARIESENAKAIAAKDKAEAVKERAAAIELAKKANEGLRQVEAHKVSKETGIGEDILLGFGGDTPDKIREYANRMLKSGVIKPKEADNSDKTKDQLPAGGGPGGSSGNGEPLSDLDKARALLTKK